MKNDKNNHFYLLFLTGILILIPAFSILAQEIIAPRCYGGNRLTREFIHEEMIYPARAFESNTEGTVKLSFIIQRDGSVTDIKVDERVSPEIDKEAIRIFSKILWFPATQLGKPIVYKHYFEIRFKIKKYLKYTKLRGYEYFAYPWKPVDTTNVVYVRKNIDKQPKPQFSAEVLNFPTFLAKNIEYPEAAFKQNVAGTVKLKFVIETSGRVSNILVVNAVGGGCTEEAIRVLKLIKWMPGIKDHYAVRTIMPLEMTFDIAKKSVGGSIPSPGQLQ